MYSYTILRKDQLPEVIRDKPSWMKCVVLVASLLAITCSAIGIGIPIGYKAGLKLGNSNSTIQILHVPVTYSNRIRQNRTINQALMSSMLVSKIVKFSRTFMNEEISYVPVSDGKPALRI